MTLPGLTLLRQFDTCRLIPSRFVEKEDSVLAALSDNDAQLADLFELDNATNSRIHTELSGATGLSASEMVFGIPNFRIINAAFAYPRPEGSRFNGPDRGAWYCAFDASSALAEIIFHKTVEYQEIKRFNDSVSYQTLLADFTATFHDIRDLASYESCLDPTSYVTSQQLAAGLLAQGSLGIIYPSVRHPGGTNLACFRPALVGNVRKGQAYRLTWRGSPHPTVEAL